MRYVRSLWTQTIMVSAFVLIVSRMAAGQAANAPARITQPIDEENLVTLRGGTHPLARPEFDRGAAPDSLPMERMLLVLQRSAEQEAALRSLLDEQQIKSSPQYHQWLTPEQFGQQFGPADADIQTVTDWLTSQGFQVSHVAAGRTVIEFSGTAGQVRQAFHTEIHKFVVNGEEHWANASDPQIPAALAPVMAGFASLNNFPKKPRVNRLGTFSKSKATGEVRPLFTFPYKTTSLYAVGAIDFATIYNLTPLWNASTDGTGQTIALSEQSDINPQDVTDFRTIFGLPTTTNYLQRIYNGPSPGVLSTTGDESEADLDVQWAGAVAKGATVDMVISETTTTTAGVDLSALYIIDNNISPILSESYGTCEAFDGTYGNDFYYTLWEQGAAQGITILIAAGDSGSAGCDDPTTEVAAQDGLAVAGNATTPFNVAVGGTDFNDAGNPSLYWNATNGSGQSSAKSYIPEMTWNDSCASTGSLSNCNTDVPIDPAGVDLTGGSGGPSNCATSTTVGEEIECTAGVPKPAWQSGPGVPTETPPVRDTPDVSLFAGDAYVSGSFYVYCQMDANATMGGAAAQGGGSPTSCDLNAPYLDFQGAGGTSFSTPAFAGIMAMVNQKTGQRQGNANYVLYPLAAQTGASCPSNASAVGNNSCIFYDIQTGNNSVACDGETLNCSDTTNTTGYGILVVPSTTNQPAWATSAGYDYATGLGTVNAANLVNNWTSVSFAPTTTTLSLSPTTVTHGTAVNVNIGVTSSSGTPAGDVSLIGGPSSSNLGIDFATLSNGTISGTTAMLPGGTYGVTARYAGNGTFGSSTSSPPVQVTVSPESSQTLVRLVTFTCSALSYTGTTVPYGYNVVCSGVVYPGYFLRVDVTNSSGNACFSSTTGSIVYACPAGVVTLTDNGGPPTDLGAPAGTPGTYTLNSQGHFEDQFIQLSGGSNALVANYAGNNSYAASDGTLNVSVTPAGTTTSLTAPTTAQSGGSVTLTAVVNTTSIGLAPSGTVQFQNAGTVIPGTVNYTPANAPTSSTNPYASLTATLTTSFTGNATITAQYSGDGNYTTSTSTSAAISVTSVGDFSLVASPSSISIPAPGDSENSTISLSAINGFTGTVSFTCAPTTTTAGISCALVPTSLTVTTASSQGSTLLTVSTTSSISPFNSPRWLLPIGGAIFAVFFLLFIPTKRRRLKLAFGSLFLVLLAAALIACGGGSSVSTTTSSSSGTPTGNYTVTVTATGSTSSGTISHSLNVPVAVQ